MHDYIVYIGLIAVDCRPLETPTLPVAVVWQHYKNNL